MSLGSILNIARSGLLTAQRAVEITSNNVANAQTEGYSRQRIDTIGATANRTTDGEFGTGVRVIGTSRARDQFLDAAFRRSSAEAAGGRVRSGVLSRLEAVLGEPSDSGIGASLDRFHSAWSDFAARPNAGGTQAAVQQAGAQFAVQLNDVARQVDDLAAETRQRLDAGVSEVNAIATAVADLNRQIAAQEAGGQSANALRDTRDRQLDRLTELTGADVIERANGSVAVLIGGLTLVDGAETSLLAATTLNGRTEVTRVSQSTTPIGIGGSLGALRAASVVDIPRLQADLDALARGVVESVNAIHRQGVTWAGSPPVATPAGDFFASDPLLTAETDSLRTARGIRLDSAVAASPSAIAASGATATGPGDGSIALQIAGLRTSATVFTNADATPRTTESAGDFLRRIATDVAFTTKRITDRAEIDDVLATQGETRRQEVSGVSVDEELVRLMKFQQAYAAAARLISAADAMSQTLLDLRR